MLNTSGLFVVKKIVFVFTLTGRVFRDAKNRFNGGL